MTTYEESLAAFGRSADREIASLQAEFDEYKFVVGETEPDAWNQGPRKSPLRIERTKATITSAGATYDRIQFDADVDFAGTDNNFNDCIFRSRRDPRSVPRATIVSTSLANRGNVLNHCDIYPQAISPLNDAGIMGHNFTLRRTRVRGHIDGVGIYHPTLNAPQNVYVEGSWIEGLAYFCPYPGQSDNRSHNDGVQIHRHIHNVHFYGSRIDALIDPRFGAGTSPVVRDATGKDVSGYRFYPEYYAMSAFMLSPMSTGGKIQKFTVDSSWLNGGEVMFNFGTWTDVGVAPGQVIITNNRIGSYRQRTPTWPNGALVIAKKTMPAIIDGNVEKDTGAPMNIRVNG